MTTRMRGAATPSRGAQAAAATIAMMPPMATSAYSIVDRTETREAQPVGRVSVPALGLRVAPRAARGAVPAGDVAEPPGDLRRRVGRPVAARGRHLLAGQRLRDAVGARADIVRVDVPVRFLVPQGDEAAVFP